MLYCLFFLGETLHFSVFDGQNPYIFFSHCRLPIQILKPGNIWMYSLLCSASDVFENYLSIHELAEHFFQLEGKLRDGRFRSLGCL